MTAKGLAEISGGDILYYMLKSISSVVWGSVYTLIQIEDKKTPLTMFPQDGRYVGIVIIMMVLSIVSCAASVYLIICCKSRARIRQLQKGERGKLGWNLWRLRETVIDMELQEAEQIVNDME